MKKIITSLCVLTGTLTFAQEYNSLYPTNAINLYSQDMNVGNAKYTGVAGAVGALGSDINAVEQNPAGLGVAINSDVQITLGVSSFNNKTNFGTSLKESDNEFNIQQFGGTFVFENPGSKWNRFTVGVAYLNQRLNNSSSIGTNQNIVLPTTPDNTDTYVFGGYAKGIDGYKSKFSLNFGTSYDDKLYLGAGLNFHESNFSSFEQYGDLNQTQNQMFVYNRNGFPASEIGQGFSLSLGAIYKINHNVRLGGAYHSPVWYNISEDYYAANNFNEVNRTVDSYYMYSSDYDMTRGGRLVGSLGFVIGKNFSLGADYTYHMNTDTKFKPSGAFTGSNNFVNDFVQNSSEVRVGGEYRVDRFKVRAGYNYVSSPFKDIYMNNLVDQNGNSIANQPIKNAFAGDINRASFGLGYDFGGFYIDAAYQYQTQKYQNIIGNSTYIDNDNYYVSLNDSYAPSVKLNNSLFLLTLGWQF